MYNENFAPEAKASAGQTDADFRVAQNNSAQSEAFTEMIRSAQEAQKSQPADLSGLLGLSQMANPAIMTIGSVAQAHAPYRPLQPGNATLADALAMERGYLAGYRARGLGSAGLAVAANIGLEKTVFDKTHYGLASAAGDTLASAAACSPLSLFGSKAFLAKTGVMLGAHLLGRGADAAMHSREPAKIQVTFETSPSMHPPESTHPKSKLPGR